MIKLSIIIPSYNKEKQLSRLLDSIVESDFFDDTIEVIISDDCSTDNTKEMVKPYLDKFKNLIYLLPEKNGGVHTARNLGMKKATGKYIGFIDGDDWFNQDGLQIILEDIDKYSEYDLIFFPYITSDTKELTGFNKIGAIKFEELFDDDFIFRKNKNCFVTINREVIISNNISWYYTNLDSLFWREVEYYSKNQIVLSTDKIVGVYDKSTEGSLSKKRTDISHLQKTSDKKIENTLVFLERMDPFFLKRKDIACRYIFSLEKDLIVSKCRNRNYEKMKQVAKKYNCSCSKLFIMNIYPLVLFRVNLKIKNFIKQILRGING